MSRPRDERQKDLYQPALDQIINMGHPVVKLAGEIDWSFLDRRFDAVCRPGRGQPPLPTRLVAGLLILKHMHNLSDEALCGGGWRTRTTSTSAASRFSVTSCPLTARR